MVKSVIIRVESVIIMVDSVIITVESVNIRVNLSVFCVICPYYVGICHY